MKKYTLPRKTLEIIKIIALAVMCFIIIVVVHVANLFAQELQVNAIWPDSMRSMHANKSSEFSYQEENGGNGFFITLTGIDKYFQIGIGKIWLTNSLNDPAEVEILQLMDADYELYFANVGIAIWDMSIKGYFDEDGDPILVKTGPWPVPHMSINPLYPWIKDVYITGRYVQFPGVYITYFEIGYRFII